MKVKPIHADIIFLSQHSAPKYEEYAKVILGTSSLDERTIYRISNPRLLEAAAGTLVVGSLSSTWSKIKKVWKRIKEPAKAVSILASLAALGYLLEGINDYGFRKARKEGVKHVPLKEVYYYLKQHFKRKATAAEGEPVKIKIKVKEQDWKKKLWVAIKKAWKKVVFVAKTLLRKGKNFGRKILRYIIPMYLTALIQGTLTYFTLEAVRFIDIYFGSRLARVALKAPIYYIKELGLNAFLRPVKKMLRQLDYPI